MSRSSPSTAMRATISFAAIGFVACAAPVAGAATNVAVFNFEMTSETPQWKWLQKGLADRIATDFVQDRSLQVTARDEMQLLAGPRPP